MNNIKAFFTFILLVSFLTACVPQAAMELTPTLPEPTQTINPPTATLTTTPLPTETLLPTEPPSPTPPSCAVPLSPTENATIPAQGPFDFTWTAFAGATNYVVSIGPANWYPTDFQVNDTTLTRYMETFPSSSSYQWSISALNASGQKICTAGPYTFVTSKELRATPSFQINASGGGEPTDANPTDSGSDLSAYVTVDEFSCRLVATVIIDTSVDRVDAALWYGTDPNHFDNEQGLSSTFPRDSRGVGTFQIDIKDGYHKGDTIYFLVTVKTRLAKLHTESELVSHTMSCDP